MFCNKCGYELNDTMAFCPMCGTKVHNISEEATGSDEEDDSKKSEEIIEPEQISFDNGKSKKKRPRVGVICTIVVVIAILGVVFVALRNDTGSNTASEEIALRENEPVYPGISDETQTDLITKQDDKTESTNSIVEESVATETTETDVNVEETVAPTASSTESTENATVLNKTTSKVEYNTAMSIDGLSCWGFTKSRKVGFGRVVGDYIDYEGYYGTSASIDGNTLTWNYYNHSPNASDTATITIEKYSDKSVIQNVGTVKKDENHTLDLSSLANGIYYIKQIQADGGNKGNYTYQYFYVNGTDSYLCRVDANKDVYVLQMELDAWDEITSQIDVNEALEMDELTYPTSGANGHVNDVAKIAEFSHTLIKDEWTDDAKVFAFTMWISQNIAYDAYKLNTMHTARAKYVSTDTYDGYCDENNFAWTSHVGVCADFTNMLAIMCRENGIPCTSVDNVEHTWNAVYLDKHWIPIDITEIIEHRCNSLDTTQITNYNVKDYITSDGYGLYDNATNIDSYGKQIWTYENATNPDNNYQGKYSQ